MRKRVAWWPPKSHIAPGISDVGCFLAQPVVWILEPLSDLPPTFQRLEQSWVYTGVGVPGAGGELVWVSRLFPIRSFCPMQ